MKTTSGCLSRSLGMAAAVLLVSPAVRLAAAPLTIAERAACSSLAQCKQSTEKAFQAIAALGYRWVDLSCLNWAPHASVPELLKDFDQEATRIEQLLRTHKLQVANLTFDSFEKRPFDEYQKQFEVVARLAARLKARLINLMAPSPKADRAEVVATLRKLVALAKAHGVILTVETHVNQLTERPDDAIWLCQQVPGLGLTLDPSHYYAGPHQGASIEAVLPFVEGTGFRAGGMSWKEIQLPWGDGPIDFAALVRRLEARGYRGFYVAEYIEGFNQLDALTESRKFLEWTRKL